MFSTSAHLLDRFVPRVRNLPDRRFPSTGPANWYAGQPSVDNPIRSAIVECWDETMRWLPRLCGHCGAIYHPKRLARAVVAMFSGDGLPSWVSAVRDQQPCARRPCAGGL